MKRTPLKRKTPLRAKRPRRLKQKPMSRQSRTRRLQDDVYRTKRKAFLALRPRCEFMLWPDGTPAPRLTQSSDTTRTSYVFSEDYDGKKTTVTHELIRQCKRRSTQVHHMRGRGKWYLDERHWFPSCLQDHAWITDNGKAAERLGYLERVYDKH